jgi:hypothetical protein
VLGGWWWVVAVLLLEPPRFTAALGIEVKPLLVAFTFTWVGFPKL